MKENPHPNVMALGFTVSYGHPDTAVEMIAVYNKKKISIDEVRAHIEKGHDRYHPHILVCYPEQWKSVFKDEEVQDEV